MEARGDVPALSAALGISAGGSSGEKACQDLPQMFWTLKERRGEDNLMSLTLRNQPAGDEFMMGINAPAP